MKDRLKSLRTKLHLNQEQFGARVGVGKTAVSKMENGTYNITDSMTKLICKEFNVNYYWLVSGTGDMFSTTDSGLLDRINNLMASENEIAKRTFRTFAELDDNQWKFLEQIIDKLQQKH